MVADWCRSRSHSEGFLPFEDAMDVVGTLSDVTDWPVGRKHRISRKRHLRA